MQHKSFYATTKNRVVIFAIARLSC